MLYIDRLSIPHQHHSAVVTDIESKPQYF